MRKKDTSKAQWIVPSRHLNLREEGKQQHLKIMRVALESFLRFHGLRDPEFRFLASDIDEELIPEYRENFMQPFVEILGEVKKKGEGQKDEN